MTATAHADAPSIAPSTAPSTSPRHDWTMQEARALFELPFNDLVFRAQSVHREHFDPNEVQISTLLSIKTGACPEDCKYCPQSGHYNTGLEKEKLLEIEKVVAEPRPPRQRARPVSVWGRPGVARRRKTWNMSWIWCAR